MLSAVSLLGAGCGESEPLGTRSIGGSAKKATDKKSAAAEDTASALPVILTDEDFMEVETEKRDPFRSFAEVFRGQSTVSSQRRVILSDLAVDELRLIALVTGTPNPMAMFVDPSRVGYTVRPGDYIGRAEVVQSTSGESVPIALNWRVDRIRPDGVVLTREDPNLKASGPVPTRFIPLNDANKQKASEKYGESIIVTDDKENEVPSFEKLSPNTPPPAQNPSVSSDQ